MAAGKGVILPSTKEEAHDALKNIMLNKEFGAAGDEVVIEECTYSRTPNYPFSIVT